MSDTAIASGATPPPLVTVEGLSRRFGAVQAVERASFDVRRGEMFGLIGPDGAGKTTTLRTILGLLRPDEGRVRTCSLDPLRERRRLSAKIGYLSQKFSLYGDLSVDENVAFFAEIHDVRGYAARRDALLDMVRMTAFRDRLADRLSGGMKQKLALVCTLVHTPELLVLDEPTTGVDPVSRRDFWKLLAPPAARGPHDPADDAVPRRGRALHAGGAPRPRPACSRSTRPTRCARASRA